MKMLQRAEAKKAVVRYGGLLLGTAILSFGLYNIHSQASITEGGVLGLQLLIQHWFGISPSIIGPVMDFMCYLIGWKILGGNFLKNAIVASVSYAFSTHSMRRWDTCSPISASSGICGRTWRSVCRSRCRTCGAFRRSFRRR